MESWERTTLKWWVEEEVPVKWAVNERSERKIRKGGVGGSGEERVKIKETVNGILQP